MEFPIYKIGKIVNKYYQLGYFESDSLESAIEKMMNDSNTSFGINVQLDNNEVVNEITINKILDKNIETL